MTTKDRRVLMKYKCGYGICKNFTTIEEVKLAEFEKEEDAKEFLESRDPLSYPNNTIFYMDDGEKRYFYEYNLGDIKADINEIYMYAYKVEDEFVYDDDEYDFQETICLTHAKAKEVEQEYYASGARLVNLHEIEINVGEHFYRIDNFICPNNKSLEIKQAIASHQMHSFPGANFYNTIGKALEGFSTEELLEYFKDNISGGNELVANYIKEQITANEINKDKYRDYEEMER